MRSITISPIFSANQLKNESFLFSVQHFIFLSSNRPRKHIRPHSPTALRPISPIGRPYSPNSRPYSPIVRPQLPPKQDLVRVTLEEVLSEMPHHMQGKFYKMSGCRQNRICSESHWQRFCPRCRITCKVN
jgi:hypothetical protein